MEKEEKSKETKPQNGSPHFQEFLKVFEETKGIEEKVMHGLEFMKKALSFTGGMTFKDFWDAKKLCGPLFKEKMNPIKRNVLWSEYAELGDEARRIKEVKDEQAAFSIEQIEIAIAALEGEIAQHDHLVSQAPKIKFPKGIEKLGIDHKHYRSVQEQLQLLKTLISRLDGLRKEILAIDMRISHKSKLLRRLSKLGDEVFPKRKELIKSVSETFVKDVEFFAKRRFPEGDEKLPAPYYVIRDEIKCFQGLAKVVTLNTQAFNQSRKILSNYWDKIQVKAEEKRSEMEERIEKQNENYAALQPKIEAFETFCQQNENHTKGKILEASDALYQEMKEVDLGRDHVRELKDKIQAAQEGALQHVDAAHQKKKAAAHQKIDDVMQRLIALIEGEKKASLEELQSGEKA
ncbi:MAG: hypothetical protein KDK60_03740, partial [Chlamydiia bacterium]|nr:hypothetical protein [Chlamydiia bacterium]